MSSAIVCLGYTGSIIGIIQGIIWMFLALCALLIRFETWIPTSHGTSVLSGTLLAVYIQNPKLQLQDVIITKGVITIWVFFYLVISAAWCLLSMWQLHGVLHKKKKSYKTVFPIWIGCTYIISLSDLILTIILGIDYSTVSGIAESSDSASNDAFYILLSVGIVMTIAARGFILWIVNVVVSVALTVLLIRDKEEISDILRHHINAYESSNAAQYSQDNYGFNWDSEDTTKGLTTEGSTFNPSLPRLPPIPPIQTTNERLAKIGKLGGTKALNNVPVPTPPPTYIYPGVPSPDYSPVQDRKNAQLKSALKIRTQNVYGTTF